MKNTENIYLNPEIAKNFSIVYVSSFCK